MKIVKFFLKMSYIFLAHFERGRERRLGKVRAPSLPPYFAKASYGRPYPLKRILSIGVTQCGMCTYFEASMTIKRTLALQKI